MKPDYAKWKPPFRYDHHERMIYNDALPSEVVLRLAISPTKRAGNSSTIDEIERILGQRIAELLNKDAEEKEPS